MELPIVKKLKKDLERLRYELNTKLPKEIEEAREHGDLKENAEYHAAKERQGVVNALIGAAEQRLRELSMVDISAYPSDAIGYGSVVTVEDEQDGAESKYEIVFPEEVDAAKGKISLSSPLGRALLNKRDGDEVQVQTPRGNKVFSVLAFKTIHQRDDLDLGR
jgi:transcription elongation factor GreA